jgi:hypothetical protein
MLVNSIGCETAAGRAAAMVWKPCLCLCFGVFLQITNNLPFLRTMRHASHSVFTDDLQRQWNVRKHRKVQRCARHWPARAHTNLTFIQAFDGALLVSERAHAKSTPPNNSRLDCCCAVC